MAWHLKAKRGPASWALGVLKGLAVGSAALAGLAQAQFDPARVAVEPEAIARQFAPPAVAFTSPAFAPGRQDFTRHAEAMAFLDALAQRTGRVAMQTFGQSQQGRAMALAVLTGPRGFDARLPTVLLLAQQHGNEPAGGEAALVLAHSLANERSALLERVNVLIMPRANPDAAERFARETVNGIDVNRDHLLARTPEAQAMAAVLQRYNPQVVLDLHEFTVAGRWVSKFGTVMRADALLQAATVGNLSPAVQGAQGRYLAAARQALEAAGQRVDEYHTSSADAKDLAVAMGGVNADTGRNVAGLRNAISLLLETRGIGLGRAHYPRRVQSHVLAARAVIEAAAQDGPALVQLQREAGQAAADQACTGPMAVVVRQTAQRRTLNFLDAKTGEPRDVEVAWRSSHQLETVRERPRPCGYLIGAGQTLAVQRLRSLGVEVETLGPVSQPQPQPWEVEDYLVEAEAAGQRQDARGAIADSQTSIRVLNVQLQPRQWLPEPGSHYVSMNQPLAALVSAALEPDSQNSFAANRLLAVEGGQLRRVVSPPLLPTPPPEAAPQAQPCPQGVPEGARCLRGQDAASAHYLIVMPAQWSGVLVVHAHGGPSLGAPKASRADEDIKRWAITVREGHAWAGSVFRQGGFAVTTAAEDTERVRRIFTQHVAQPRRTLLHGQSWGAMVATRAAELYPTSWDGMLLTSGVIAGPATYDFRLDLRALYQHLCNNHPRPDESAYPLALGLPADSTLTPAELASRADECLGARKPAAQRTEAQAAKLKTIVDVLKMPEKSVISHLFWGTFTLRDVVAKNGGASPFGNEGVRYAGSGDDAALNAAIARFKAAPEAASRFAADVDHAGRFTMPVISAHGVGDSTVFVEGQDTLRQRMVAAGRGIGLVQAYVDSSEHSYWGDAHYPPLFEALLNWVEKGQLPSPQGIATRCEQLRAAQPAECRFLPGYAPKPLASRILPR